MSDITNLPLTAPTYIRISEQFLSVSERARSAQRNRVGDSKSESESQTEEDVFHLKRNEKTWLKLLPWSSSDRCHALPGK